jgi:hypothetical protein
VKFLFDFQPISLTHQKQGPLKDCVFCDVVQNLLPSRLLYRNVKIKIYKTIILPVVLGCETFSLTLREEHRLRVFENRVLRREYLDLRGMK